MAAYKCLAMTKKFAYIFQRQIFMEATQLFGLGLYQYYLPATNSIATNSIATNSIATNSIATNRETNN